MKKNEKPSVSKVRSDFESRNQIKNGISQDSWNSVSWIENFLFSKESWKKIKENIAEILTYEEYFKKYKPNEATAIVEYTKKNNRSAIRKFDAHIKNIRQIVGTGEITEVSIKKIKKEIAEVKKIIYDSK